MLLVRWFERCQRAFKSDDGSIVPLFLVVVLLVLMMGVIVGTTAEQYRKAAVAQWAADAAALAGAAEGPGATGPSSAGGLAEANDSQLVSIVMVPPPFSVADEAVSMVVVVEVEHRGVTAFAAAARFITDQNGVPSGRSFELGPGMPR